MDTTFYSHLSVSFPSPETGAKIQLQKKKGWTLSELLSNILNYYMYSHDSLLH